MNVGVVLFSFFVLSDSFLTGLFRFSVYSNIPQYVLKSQKHIQYKQPTVALDKCVWKMKKL